MSSLILHDCSSHSGDEYVIPAAVIKSIRFAAYVLMIKY